MENITLGGINGGIIFLISFIGGLITIVKAVNYAIKEALKPLYKKIDTVDINATKNFLVDRIQDIKNGAELSDIVKKQFIEQYEHYIKLGGNSYIKLEYERLVKEGKL